MENNDLALVNVDKSKAMVIIDKNKLKEKINNFIKENHINMLNKDPTEVYQKQIHQAIQKCNTLTDKQTHRYLLNIKPMAPKLNVYLKHKDNLPIRPVINNIQAPSYKTARYVNKRIQDLLKLLYTYHTQNSQEIAEELLKLQIHENIRIITLDIKDMYVNLPIPGILLTTSFWLNKHNNYNKQQNEHILHILNVIIRQNYFQYEVLPTKTRGL